MKSKKELKKQKKEAKKNPKTSASTIDKRYYFALAIVAIVTLITYYPALQNLFVWDDDDYIKNNALVHSINFKEIFSNYVMGNYHPITVLALAFEYQAFELSEKSYHMINILVHILNTLLVFYAVFLLSEKNMVALLQASSKTGFNKSADSFNIGIL